MHSSILFCVGLILTGSARLEKNEVVVVGGGSGGQTNRQQRIKVAVEALLAEDEVARS